MEAAEEDDVVLVVSHSMPAAGWGAFAFGFDAAPFARRRLEAPEVVIMVECALLWGGELAAE